MTKSESTKVLGTNATKRVTKSDLSHVFGKDSKSWYLWCGNFPNQFTRAYRYQLDTVPYSSHKKVAVPIMHLIKTSSFSYWDSSFPCDLEGHSFWDAPVERVVLTAGCLFEWRSFRFVTGASVMSQHFQIKWKSIHIYISIYIYPNLCICICICIWSYVAHIYISNHIRTTLHLANPNLLANCLYSFRLWWKSYIFRFYHSFSLEVKIMPFVRSKVIPSLFKRNQNYW